MSPYWLAEHDGYLGLCRWCGKRSFDTRKHVKKYARHRYPGGGLRAYRCRHDRRFWHVGHLAPAVKSGRLSRDAFYATAAYWGVRQSQSADTEPQHPDTDGRWAA